MCRLTSSVKILLGLGTLLAAGCMGNTRPDQFYMLAPLSAAELRPGASSRLVVGVGPVRFPDYLARPQIVTSTGPNQFKLDEFERWTEPLKDNFTRVLAENLSVLLHSDRVLLFPFPRLITPDYQVAVEVAKFHVTSEGKSLLQAQWMVMEGDTVRLLKRSDLSLPADTRSYAAMVFAQSETLAAFSREISSAVQNLARKTRVSF